MSKRDEFGMDEMLKQVAGFDLDSGDGDQEALVKGEDEKNARQGEEKKNGIAKVTAKKPGRKTTRAKKKNRTSPLKDRSDFSPTLIRKNLLKLVAVLHPGRSLQDSVEHILKKYLNKNKDRISEAMMEALNDKD